MSRWLISDCLTLCITDILSADYIGCGYLTRALLETFRRFLYAVQSAARCEHRRHKPRYINDVYNGVYSIINVQSKNGGTTAFVQTENYRVYLLCKQGFEYRVYAGV
ncbi:MULTISPECIES: hypothetical protein [Peribacillus]|uniref:hypothetical protein n=1 Tax=Peribacillus TaxID=2675229 RepID=UPI001F4E7EE7|nr:MULTISPECIES: hypothetical protein [unclassified Peribacillus]MCK1985178.1 hypothetical protein [Peribacillus sp. Aquil_B1]MCK2007172.1 hypothetical protein [Peribacillus sp. Aquil_B8]